MTDVDSEIIAMANIVEGTILIVEKWQSAHRWIAKSLWFMFGGMCVAWFALEAQYVGNALAASLLLALGVSIGIQGKINRLLNDVTIGMQKMRLRSMRP